MRHILSLIIRARETINDKIIQSIQKENETYKAQKEELSDKLKIVKMKKKLLIKIPHNLNVHEVFLL